METDVRLKRGEDGRPVPYAYPRKKRGGVLLGVRGKSLRAWPPFPRMRFAEPYPAEMGRKAACAC